MLKWKRESGSIISLQDTPEMKTFAESQGWKLAKVVLDNTKEKADGKSRRRNT